MILDVTFADVSIGSRNLREISTLIEQGYQVEVVSGPMCRKLPVNMSNIFVHEYCNIGLRKPRLYGIYCRLINQKRYLMQFNPDVVICHGYTTLLVAYLAFKSSKKRTKFIYHSHEFEMGRNSSRKRGRLLMLLVKKIEGFLMHRCSFSIVVNDSIADEVQKIHNLKNRPIVIRSVPPLWKIDKTQCEKTRCELLKMIENPQNMVLMYHGMIMKGRGIEMLLQVVEKNTQVCIIIMGNGKEEYLFKLKQMSNDLGISNRVLFYPSVPIEKLWMYIGAADVGMVTIPATTKSYYFMLPNKFFENIQSETPVICSNYPAIEKIVNQYNIGITCSPTNVDEINQCIEKMRINKEFYNQCKANIKLAKLELCWEKEKNILIDAFRRLI